MWDMGNKFVIRPRRYRDPLDAINDALEHARAKGVVIDVGLNPNGKYSLLVWARNEIIRLREKAGEWPPEQRSKIVPGPRPVAESKPITVEEE